MKIGIDLDNTIINYDQVFFSLAKKKKIIKNNNKILTKQNLKNYILKQYNGNFIWMKLQGKVYGEYILDAQIMSGFRTFLTFCNLRKYNIFIVSHKTSYGHYDKKKINLRKSAINFLDYNCLFDKKKYSLEKKKVFFLSTLDEKIKKINSLKLDVFIDDLEIIFKHPNLNKKLKNKFLFDPNNSSSMKEFNTFNNWSEINDKFFNKLTNKDIRKISYKIGIKNILKITKLNQGINSKVYKIKNNNSVFAFKFYPFKNDDRPRQKNEYNALKYLNNNKFKFVANPIFKIDDYNCTVFNWLNGKKNLKVKKNNLYNFYKFLFDLKKLSQNTNKNKFNIASEGTLNLRDISLHNTNRIIRLNKNMNFLKIKELLKDIEKLNISFNNEIENYIKNYKCKILKKEQLILSPSDISMNNILTKNNNDYYVDFEYFGWDDPVKLISDFLIHPQNKFRKNQFKKILISFFKIFENDYQIKKRFSVTFKLYALRWSLILLNDFNYFNSKSKPSSIIKKNQIKIKMSKKIINDLKNNSYMININEI